MGSDHMVQGRHAKKALVIFTLLTSYGPQNNVWGRGGGQRYRGLRRAGLRMQTDEFFLHLITLPSENMFKKLKRITITLYQVHTGLRLSVLPTKKAELVFNLAHFCLLSSNGSFLS